MGHNHNVLDNPCSNDNILSITSNNHGLSHWNISNPSSINDGLLNRNYSPNCSFLRPLHSTSRKKITKQLTRIHSFTTHWCWFSPLSSVHGCGSTHRNEAVKIRTITWFCKRSNGKDAIECVLVGATIFLCWVWRGLYVYGTIRLFSKRMS